MHTASQALAIERQASAQPSLAERVSRPKTRAILGLMRLNFLSVLFARFWRGSDKPGGCGLGLSIVEEIALRHGGKTLAETAGKQGLRVGMRLPLAENPSLSAPTTRS